jgi:hypothetical protein
MLFSQVLQKYVKLGFTHVLPFGFDHVLFIICLLLLSTNLKSLVLQCTLFTVAHSISLILAACDVISPNAHIVEPIIALSILYAAIENIVHDRLSKLRIGLIFLFGRVHGMGFANALQNIGLPGENRISALLFFNVGVELAQLAVVLGVWFLVGIWFRQKDWYRERIVFPASALIAGVAMLWFIERLLYRI